MDCRLQIIGHPFQSYSDRKQNNTVKSVKNKHTQVTDKLFH